MARLNLLHPPPRLLHPSGQMGQPRKSLSNPSTSSQRQIPKRFCVRPMQCGYRSVPRACFPYLATKRLIIKRRRKIAFAEHAFLCKQRDLRNAHHVCVTLLDTTAPFKAQQIKKRQIFIGFYKEEDEAWAEDPTMAV